MMSGVQNVGSQAISVFQNTKSTAKAEPEKPVWDGKKSYAYLEDSNRAGLEYGAKATRYYAAKTASDGELSVAELKKQIGEWFGEYTLTDREPGKVVQGKHYLYIDDSQLQKMAKDASYRAKVYGLMDRELTTGKEYTLRYSDGKDKTMHITGSIFSLSEANRKYAGADGVPYLGSAMSDHPISSSDSHVQVRSMSFLYDNLDPAKAARKSRAAAAKSQAEKLAEKRAEKKKAAKKAEKKEQLERLRQLAPSLEVSEGKELSMNRDRKMGTVALNPALLQKIESDPELAKKVNETLKGIEVAERLARNYFNALGGVTERTSHWYLDENGEIKHFAHTRREDGKNKLLREEQQKAAKEHTEKLREKMHKKSEELTKQLLERKEKESKDGNMIVDTEDVKPILETIRNEQREHLLPSGGRVDFRA